MRAINPIALLDATLARIGAFFSSLLLKRLFLQSSSQQASDIADIEARIQELQESGRPKAAEFLAQQLNAIGADDPTQFITRFSENLLGEQSTQPSLEDGTQKPRKQRRGRPPKNVAQNGQIPSNT